MGAWVASASTAPGIAASDSGADACTYEVLGRLWCRAWSLGLDIDGPPTPVIRT